MSPQMTIDSDNVNVLMACDAQRTGGLERLWPQDAVKRFWVQNWTSTDDRFTWIVEAPEEDDYAVAMIVCSHPKIVASCKGSSSPVEVELAAGRSRLTHEVAYRDVSPCTQWSRERVQGLLHLRAGANTITLRAVKEPEQGTLNLALFAVELTRPDARASLDRAAMKLRSDTSWMAEAGYGMFFHWNAATAPLRGPAKPFEEAVRDFDVEKFAAMVEQTGAGFVVFTTSWARYTFPAPIAAIDRIVPGRTTSRDLPDDLADALGRRGIRLVLYYHMGHGDEPWWSKQNFGSEDKATFFDNWRAVISEVGGRYGRKLAGFWFDDAGLAYYPYRAPWQELTQAAKTGNADRVVGYNCWVLPKPTDFQDFYTGEIGLDEADNIPFLPVGGTGRFTGGPQEGLQATVCGTMEPGDWTHTSPNTDLPDPMFGAERMIKEYRSAVERKLVPIMNMSISQEGEVSPKTLDLFQAVRKEIKGR